MTGKSTGAVRGVSGAAAAFLVNPFFLNLRILVVVNISILSFVLNVNLP